VERTSIWQHGLMHGGNDEPNSAVEPLAPRQPDEASPVGPGRGALGTPADGATRRTRPSLPPTEGTATPAVVPGPKMPTRGAETWYRNEQDRFRSVHRRANPWYRRVARSVIGLCFLAAGGVGLYFGAQLVQDYLDRDRLPSVGQDVPTIRATSFEIRSNAPAPVLDGTLTLDTATKAFEFLGRGTGQQAGVQIVSPDGAAVYARSGTSNWELAAPGDKIAADAKVAAEYLYDDDSADDILTTPWRRDFVELIERTELGTGKAELRRFELRLDTDTFEDRSPVQFGDFQRQAIPGVRAARALRVTITLDHDTVLVQVDDEGTNWSWQRLTYSDQPFTPVDPTR
jgi:hypothetical protein